MGKMGVLCAVVADVVVIYVVVMNFVIIVVVSVVSVIYSTVIGTAIGDAVSNKCVIFGFNVIFAEKEGALCDYIACYFFFLFVIFLTQ